MFTDENPIFFFICTFGIDLFNLIFFGQNVVNENIYTLWFPFSPAAGFLCLLHQTRGGAGSSCTVCGSKVLWKKPRPTGLAQGTKCVGGSLARRRKGPETDREWMTCLHHQFSSWKAIVLLLVELCSWGLSSLLIPVLTGHPLALGSPPYLPFAGFLFLLLLLLMRWIIIIIIAIAKILKYFYKSNYVCNNVAHVTKATPQTHSFTS